MLPCNDCIHKKDIPGDAHIQCDFDWSDSDLQKPEGDEHGVKNGWFMFPYNYDPTWGPDDCEAFESK